jgi:hypothetical protein
MNDNPLLMANKKPNQYRLGLEEIKQNKNTNVEQQVIQEKNPNIYLRFISYLFKKGRKEN